MRTSYWDTKWIVIYSADMTRQTNFIAQIDCYSFSGLFADARGFADKTNISGSNGISHVLDRKSVV